MRSNKIVAWADEDADVLRTGWIPSVFLIGPDDGDGRARNEMRREAEKIKRRRKITKWISKVATLTSELPVLPRVARIVLRCFMVRTRKKHARHDRAAAGDKPTRRRRVMYEDDNRQITATIGPPYHPRCAHLAYNGVRRLLENCATAKRFRS